MALDHPRVERAVARRPASSVAQVRQHPECTSALHDVWADVRCSECMGLWRLAAELEAAVRSSGETMRQDTEGVACGE